MSFRAATLSGMLLCHPFLLDTSRAQLTPANATFTVRGTVVNSVTGEPVQRVLVQISGDRQRHILTGADGKFEFQGVPPGAITIGLQKPGYFPEQAILARRGQPAFITVGPDQPPAVLKLIPEAVISGHVLGDGGEPVEGLPLQLIGAQVQNGRKTWNVISSTQTDDQGEFRCADLQPGRYYVFAGPSSWPASFTPRPRVQARAQMPALGEGRPAARGYPGVFYPAAEDRDSATAVEVKPGQHLEVNFNLASQRFHTISGTVSGYLTGHQGLNLEATNPAGRQINASSNFDAERGTFRTQWLPAGRYTLSAETRDNEGHGSYATLDVNLTSDVTGIHLQLMPGATIPVTFRVEKTRSDSDTAEAAFRQLFTRRNGVERHGYEPARVVLTPLDNSSGKGQRQFSSQLAEGENGGIEIPGLPPGAYSVQVHANGPYYIASAHCGPVNVLGQSLTIAAGASVQPIEIVLRDDYGNLLGSVKLPATADSAMVFAVSEAGDRPVQNTTASQPPMPSRGGQLESSFALQLAPGTYRVFAVRNADEFEYGDPDLLRKYADSGQQVTIAPNQQTKIELDVVNVEN